MHKPEGAAMPSDQEPVLTIRPAARQGGVCTCLTCSVELDGDPATDLQSLYSAYCTLASKLMIE